MSENRARRVQEAMKKEASDIIRKMKDPRLGFVTVTDAEVSRDLQHAKIFVSIYGDEEDRVRTMEALETAAGYVRTELGRRIRLRHTPEVEFKMDDSMVRGARIMKLLHEVETTSGPSEDEPNA